jgi:hypothetical protein
VRGLTGARRKSLLKSDNEGPPRRGSGGLANDDVNRDVFPALTLGSDLCHRERLHDAFRARIEPDGGVLFDDRTVEGSRRFEELEKSLFFGGRGARG